MPAARGSSGSLKHSRCSCAMGCAAAFDCGPTVVCGGPAMWSSPRCLEPRNDRPEDHEPLDESLLRDARAALAVGSRFKAACMIRNRDRTVGARVAGEIGAGRLKPAGAMAAGIRPLPFFEARFVGSAGQSFGAFTTEGMLLTLEGEANAYLGKG